MARGDFVQLENNLESTVSHMRVVRNAVRDEAQVRATIAKGLLAGHRDTGDAHIEVGHVGNLRAPDYKVSLAASGGVEAPASIEFGRPGGETHDGKRVGTMEGLHILERAFGHNWRRG